MGDEPWNAHAARQALILLREAHDEWAALLPLAHNPISDPDPAQTLRTMHQRGASVLTWARGLDDMATPPDGLPSYPITSAAPDELIDSAVYACNRSVHQLIPVGHYSPGGRTYPRTGPRTYAPVGITWITESALPPTEADSGPTRSRRRAAYLRRWAGRPMADGLAEVRTFMDAEIGPAVDL